MDLESIKRLNTPHFCQWYLKRLQAILDKEKLAEYSHMSCESFDDLSKIVEQSQDPYKWDQLARRWVLNYPLIYCHARIANTIGEYETCELTENFIRDRGIGIVPFFPGYIAEYKAPDGELNNFFWSVSEYYTIGLWGEILAYIEEGKSRKFIANFIFDYMDCESMDTLTSHVKEKFEPPYYDFDMDQGSHDGFLYSGYDEKRMILPNKELRKRVLTPPAESVKCSTVETKQKGNKMMPTIKETAIKSKDQVIKTAIGQAGVAGIKSLILTALPMKIGFIGRLLGRHKRAANSSLVVAGVAILANQIGQKYISNETAKNALQATQDQALSEVLNEYVGIEKRVTKVVENSLQLDKQPVTVEQE